MKKSAFIPVITLFAFLAGCDYVSSSLNGKPWWISSVKRQYNEAKSALLQAATLQERHYLRNNTYTKDMTELGFPVSDNFETDSGSYIVDVTFADANGFSAIANYQKDDAESRECQWFTIAGDGSKKSGPNPDCWTI